MLLYAEQAAISFLIFSLKPLGSYKKAYFQKVRLRLPILRCLCFGEAAFGIQGPEGRRLPNSLIRLRQ